MSVSGVSSTSRFTSTVRMGGLATGLDTDTLVSQLMSTERVPLDKILQKKQIAEWKRDSYRDMSALLRGIKSDFLDTLKPANNMLSQSTYKKFSCVSGDSSYVTVSGNSDAAAGSHSISIYNLATADKAVSGAGVTDALQGTAVADYNLSGKSIKVTLDGVTKEIFLDNYTAGTDNVVTKAGTGLQALLDIAFGTGKITASYDVGSGSVGLASAGGASKITITSGSNTATDALSSLGFSAGQSNRIDTSKSLETLSTKFKNDLTFDANGKLTFTINSKTFEFDKSVSLASMMSAVSSDTTANVSMSYDEASDKFILTAKQFGSGDNIRIDTTSQGGNFFGAGSASGIDVVNGSAVITAENQGVDAKVKIDGQTLVRSSNSFTLNGLTYNLLKPNAAPDTESVNINVSADVDGVYNSIKAFVERYNEVIDKINTKLSEKYDRNYQPLTDDQKKAMSADDIKKWEEKAQTGLLRNDSILQDVVYSMRSALYAEVSGITGNLTTIGITTGLYSQKGKLVIDETKLKDAIRNDPDKVMNLFSQKSTTYPNNYRLTTDQKAVRSKEEGLAYRISDILDNCVGSTGVKGTLLQKAGIAGDSTEYDNLIYKEIAGYNTSITSLTAKLTDKENAYYKKFANLETIISKMNSQSSWLASQFGQSG